MKLGEGKYEVLHGEVIDPGTSSCSQMPDQETAGKQLCREGPQGDGRQADHKPAMHPCGKESQQHFGLLDYYQQIQQSDPQPLFSTGKATSGVLQNWDL